jgi:acyl carrier protein
MSMSAASPDGLFDQVVSVIAPFAKERAPLDGLGAEASLLRDLRVSSARLVEVVLRLQERFGIEISDDDADRVRTVGDTVRLVARLRGAG